MSGRRLTALGQFHFFMPRCNCICGSCSCPAAVTGIACFPLHMRSMVSCHCFPASSHPIYPGFQAIFMLSSLSIHIDFAVPLTKHSLSLSQKPSGSRVQISLAWISLWIIDLPQCGAASAKEWNTCCTWKAAQLHKKNPGLRLHNLHRKRMEKAVAVILVLLQCCFGVPLPAREFADEADRC